MGRRRRRPNIPVTLTLPAEAPTPEEIDLVLMVTDAIIGQAGRNGVNLILKGSRSKKVYEWEWDRVTRHLSTSRRLDRWPSHSNIPNLAGY